ncbi:MAG: lysoplasmalogenase family protein, partial [Gemmatimonadaceae bacterium]
MTKRTLLTALFGIAAVLRIGADAMGWQILDYVMTPLATILVIAIAWFDPGDEVDSYRRFVLAGLLFSLIGDVFLMLPEDRFLAGLASFLFAHLSYTIAFTRDGGFTGSPVVTLPLAL